MQVLESVHSCSAVLSHPRRREPTGTSGVTAREGVGGREHRWTPHIAIPATGTLHFVLL